MPDLNPVKTERNQLVQKLKVVVKAGVGKHRNSACVVDSLKRFLGGGKGRFDKHAVFAAFFKKGIEKLAEDGGGKAAFKKRLHNVLLIDIG